MAENILQDVFLKIWQNIDSFDVSKGRFLTWAMNISRNASIDHVRSKSHRNEKVTDGSDAFPEQSHFTETKVDHIGLKEVIGRLDPKYRQLIDLLYFEGYTQAEVAEELAMPLRTVKRQGEKSFFRTKNSFEMTQELEKYIASGIIEKYCLGMASQSEAGELERLAAQYPQVRAELEAAQSAFNWLCEAIRTFAIG